MHSKSEARDLLTFVLLHYNTLEHTVRCVESLLRQKNAKIHAIVVNNASTDDSGKRLTELYTSHDSITVLECEENLGYARGINVGYQYAKEVLKSTYICLSNNDIVFDDATLARKVCEVFREKGCDVLGPAIYVPAWDAYQNPQLSQLPTVKQVDKLIWRYRFRRLRLQLGYNKPIGKPERVYDTTDGQPLEKCAKPGSEWNVQLHGACVFVGPRFIAERDGMNPATVFCCEEDILFLECLSAGYSLLYWSDVEVIHNAHSTFKVDARSRRKADIRFLKHLIVSTRLFRDMLSEAVVPRTPPEGVLPSPSRSGSGPEKARPARTGRA